ncbi:hypothetical protein V1478_010540 [Vespula squamosa]|uniref:Uncharacterized protein n=1 Tax=Vespula squamosa TaxID=30214 RepID=A0ABD2AI30_VESSQ
MNRTEDEAIAGLPTNGNTPPLSELLAMVVVVRIPAGESIDFQLASIRSPYSPEISVREIPAGAWKHLSNRKLVSSSKANRWIGSWFKAGPFEQSKYREGMESGSERSWIPLGTNHVGRRKDKKKKREEKDVPPTIHPHVLRDEEDFGCGL